MDDLFQLRQDMDREQLQRFAQESLQTETNDNAYMQRSQNMQMTADELQAKYGKKQKAAVSAPVELDMPPQDADEKESTRKRRERRILARHEKALRQNRPQGREQWFQEKMEEIRRTGKINREAGDFFAIRLQEDHFSPRYVFEHFAEIRQQLDSFKEQIDFYDKIRTDSNLLPMEYQIRLEEMKSMHERAEFAVLTALDAMGYRYEEVKPGKYGFSKRQADPEDIETAKEYNLRARRDLKEIAETTDEVVADQLVKASQQQLEPAYVTMREDMKNDPNTSFIPSDYLTNPYQFEAVKEVRDLMTKHPDQYRAQKKVLDRMYQEFFHLMEVNGTLNESSTAINNLINAETMLASRKMERVLVRRQDALEKKMGLIRDRANYILKGMKHLLRGDKLSDRAALAVREYMEPEDAMQERKAAAAAAGVYADMLGEREAIFKSLSTSIYGGRADEVLTEENRRYLMFMEPGQQEHNEQVVRLLEVKKQADERIRAGGGQAAAASVEIGRAMKPVAVRYLEKMRDFDAKDLESCTDEELLARMEELSEMSIQGAQMVEAAKYTDPDDPQGRSIWDAFCGDDSDRMLFALKCSIVQSYALRARSLAMIRAYEKDALTEECFSLDDIGELAYANDIDFVSGERFSREHMLTFAKRKLEQSEAMKDAAYNRYYHSDVMFNKYAEWKYEIPEGHPEYQRKLKEAQQEGMRALGIDKSLEIRSIETYYKQVKNQIAEITHELEKKDVSDEYSKEREAEILRLRERCEFLQNLYALSRQHYTLSDGSGEELIREPVFRSYGSVEGIPSFHNMSEEDFRTMCRQLSAGALEQKTATPEELEGYKAENVRGLLTYKAHMAQHYEELEARFHHRLPSMVYIEEHREELTSLFGNVQVDMNLTEHSKDMIDMSKPEDARIYHLVCVYNAIAAYITNTGKPMVGQRTVNYKEVAEGLKTLMRREKASFDYLDANP